MLQILETLVRFSRRRTMLWTYSRSCVDIFIEILFSCWWSYCRKRPKSGGVSGLPIDTEGNGFSLRMDLDTSHCKSAMLTGTITSFYGADMNSG